MKEFHRRDFANRTGLAQAWTVKSADRLFTQSDKMSGLQFRPDNWAIRTDCTITLPGKPPDIRSRATTIPPSEKATSFKMQVKKFE